MSRFGPLAPVTPRSLVESSTGPTAPRTTRGPSFDEILAGRSAAGGTVKLSDEARAVLRAHGVELTPVELDRIGRAMDRLAEAGGRDGLLVSTKGAFTVSVPDRTVVSAAVGPDTHTDQVFTQIDSAVLIEDA